MITKRRDGVEIRSRVVIAAGRVFEEGTHQRLKARNGVYAVLAKSQQLHDSLSSSSPPGVDVAI